MANLESIILKLLQNTTNEGQVDGFKEIQQLFKDKSVVISLCNCVTDSAEPQVRRYAALLLRRKILKQKEWRKTDPEIRQGLKNKILAAFLKENEKVVRASITELIAAMAKHELPENKWPELMTLLNESIRSKNAADREVSLNTISIIAKNLGSQFRAHYKSLLSLFQNTLTDTSSIDIPFYTIKALTHMVSNVKSEEMNLFQLLVPNVITITKLIAAEDQAKACECLEIFEELAESEVAILQPHIKSLVELGLEIASSGKFESELRIKAVSIISYIIRLKKKTIIKQHLVQPIMEVFFPLMCERCPADDDEDDELELSLPSAVGQAFDIMALHLPPAKFLPPLLMQHLNGAFESNDPLKKKAAYLVLAVIAEGCSEFIRHKYLPIFIPLIIRGLKDQEYFVRNAALYAVGQYAEVLQPEVSKFAPELLPVLFEHLEQTCYLLQQGNKNPPSLTRTFYAVERFCENLDDIEQYLPKLMNCMTTFLSISTVDHVIVKTLAVEAIGSVACAAKSHFVPYFQPIMEILKSFISVEKTPSEEVRSLQTQSIDTLAVIARTVGEETFMPLARDCVTWGLNLMIETDDPDVRRSCYSLLSSVSVVLKAEMSPYLKIIVERMIESLKSTEDISISTGNAGDPSTAFTLFENADDEDEDPMAGDNFANLEDGATEEEDDDDITGYSVENAYVEEKEAAVIALKELANEIGVPFLPYIEVCTTEIRKLTEHHSEDVRKSAISALGQFCVTLNEISINMNNLECRVALEANLTALFPKLCSLAREDTEYVVVLACLETLEEIITKIKGNALNAAYLDSICQLIKDVFKNKLGCQDQDTSDDDEQEAEYDNLVMECAGELIPALIKVVPWPQFAPYLAGFMPLLLAKTKKACTVAEKSFSIGALAEIVHNMSPGSVQPFLQHIQPVFLAGMKEENEEVRSNAVYGIGVMAENAGQIVFDQYPLYLQALSNMLATEEDARARDNICGAVARLIKTNVAGVPLETVFPVFLQSLPLQKDQEENATVFQCMCYLQNIRCEQFFQNIPQILKICSEAIASGKLDEQCMSIVSAMLNNICTEFPADFENLLKSLPPANVEALMKARTT